MMQSQTNASRPSGLPPSQGGRYEGFGSTPTPETDQSPPFGLSSANAPSLTDFQNDPMKALGKGWSLFAAVAAGAGRAVNENVIQPGMEAAMDPSLRATAAGYVSSASKKAAEVASGANDWGKNRFGVDVIGKAKETLVGPGSRGEYSSLANSHSGQDWEGAELYHDDDDDDEDFFEKQMKSQSSASTSSRVETKAVPSKPSTTLAHDDEDEEWKDF